MKGGMVTQAAAELGLPVPTLKHYIRKHTTLRDAMFESRETFVDEAETSLRSLVKDKNLTAVIFTLKCLGQNRGYIDTPVRGKDQQAPIIINLLPASADVKLPKAIVSKGNKSKVVGGEQNRMLALASKNAEEYVDDDEDAVLPKKKATVERTIEIESEASNG
jgi:hypothetical protein